MPTAGHGLDTISNFSETNGDVLDLRNAMAATAWPRTTATLSSWLVVSALEGDTTLSVRTVAGGPASMVAVLHGVGSLGLADLLSHNSLRLT